MQRLEAEKLVKSDGSRPAAPLALIDRHLPLWRLVLILALPVLAQHFLHLAVSVSDRLLAGHFLGLTAEQRQASAAARARAVGLAADHSLAGLTSAAGLLVEADRTVARPVAYQAAQTTAGYLQWFIGSFTVLVSAGSTALVARFVGGHDRAGASHATNQSLLLAALFGAAGSAAGLIWIRELVGLLQLRGDAADLAADYLRPLLWTLTLQMIEVVGIACLIGAGDTLTGMWVMSGVALANLPLAWGFFNGWGPLPELGFVGISTGTAVSHSLGCLAILIILAIGRSGLRISLPRLWPNGGLIRRLLRVSLPAGLDSLSVAVCQFWFLSIINRLGDNAASAAHGHALQWEGLGYLSGAAFQAAAMTLVSQNLGANRPEMAARSGWTAFALGCGVMCVMGLVFYVLAEPMLRVFSPHTEQAAVVIQGVPVLRLVAFAMPAVASTIIFTGALRGAGDTRVPVLFTWFGFLGVRIPLAYWFTQSLGWGLLGAWWAMFADLMVRGLLFLFRFASGRWKSIKV